MGFYDDLINGLERHVREVYENKPGRFAKALNVPVNQITRMLKRERAPQVDTVGPWLDFVGVRIVFPCDQLETLPKCDALDPLTARTQGIVKTLRDSGVAEMEILRAVRSMLDAEIDKAKQSSYQAHETTPNFSTAAEPKEEFGKK